VDVFVRKLRAKLQKHSSGWSYIHTHFGVGYRFEPESELGDAGVPGAESVGVDAKLAEQSADADVDLVADHPDGI
jgi:hypothetical protein